MKGNFIRINILLSLDSSSQPEKKSMQNIAKNLEFFIFFKKRPKDDLNMARKHFLTLSTA